MNPNPTTPVLPSALLREAVLELVGRPSRTATMAAGLVFAVALLLASAGLTRSTEAQVARRFAALAATSLTVTPSTEPDSAPLPWDAGEKAMAINGVEVAGTRAEESSPRNVVGNGTTDAPNVMVQERLPVVALSPGYLPAVRAQVTGRSLTSLDQQRHEMVALLGSGAAQRLAINQTPAFVTVDGFPLSVVGVVSDLDGDANLLHAVIVPSTVGKQLFGLPHPTQALVRTRPGAAEIVAPQIGLAIDPAHPDNLKVTSAVTPTQTRDLVGADLRGLLIVMGVLAALISVASITNVMSSAVYERTGEIGLRRALGATNKAIGGQLLLEALTMGLIAGVVGVTLGLLAIAVVCLARGWPPTIDSWMPVAAPVGAALTALVAGSYPAWRAIRIEPVTALRH